MGFDLYGENPVIRYIDEEKYPTYDKYVSMDWDEQREIFEKDKELQEKYYEEWRLRDAENPGTYFRSNVWWWRRLWSYTAYHCKDILTQEDIQHGEYNDNHLISEEKASAIAKKLQEKIDDGDAKVYENELKLAMEQCEKDDNGQPKDWDMMYPFQVSVLQEFILFCSESGGFRIG